MFTKARADLPSVVGGNRFRPARLRAGYTKNSIVHHGRLGDGVHLIGKPFKSEQLAVKVAEILDGPGRAQATEGNGVELKPRRDD